MISLSKVCDSLGPFLERPDRIRSVFRFFSRSPLKTANAERNGEQRRETELKLKTERKRSGIWKIEKTAVKR